MVDSPKSAMQARRSLLTRMFAFVDGWGVSIGAFYYRGSETHSFQVSVDHAEVVHVFQPIRNADQLNSTSVTLLRGQVTTYKFSAVHVAIPLNEFVDVSILHPL